MDESINGYDFSQSLDEVMKAENLDDPTQHTTGGLIISSVGRYSTDGKRRSSVYCSYTALATIAEEQEGRQLDSASPGPVLISAVRSMDISPKELQIEVQPVTKLQSPPVDFYAVTNSKKISQESSKMGKQMLPRFSAPVIRSVNITSIKKQDVTVVLKPNVISASPKRPSSILFAPRLDKPQGISVTSPLKHVVGPLSKLQTRLSTPVRRVTQSSIQTPYQSGRFSYNVQMLPTNESIKSMSNSRESIGEQNLLRDVANLRRENARLKEDISKRDVVIRNLELRTQTLENEIKDYRRTSIRQKK